MASITFHGIVTVLPSVFIRFLVEDMRAWHWALVCALLLRLGMVVYGAYHDANFAVKFTDVDYYVYTDASRAVWTGGSPYDRHTYRYTPLLAFLLIPNVTFNLSFGKVLFVAADLLVAVMQKTLLLRRGSSERVATLLVCVCWLFNPFVFTVSARGNADVLVVLLALTLPVFLPTCGTGKRREVLAAIFFGLAVHLKIYPIVHAPAAILLLRTKDTSVWRSCLPFLWNKRQWRFFVLSAGVFVALLLSLYRLYGYEFLYETYLYHAVRKDNRHNFSLYFYALYLMFDQAQRAFRMGMLAFVPQMSLVAVQAVTLHADLPLCMLVQTMTFVAFNKVSTAQYFVWWLGLLPVVLGQVRPAKTLWARYRSKVAVFALWALSEFHWLFWAAQLEFQGEQVFLPLWAASALLFVTSCLCMFDLLRTHCFLPPLLSASTKNKRD